ncbi:MAG: DUF3786 domain-containing protein [Desulfatibacillaceae bacterium]
MSTNYAEIIRNNLDRAFSTGAADMAPRMGAVEAGGVYRFRAFGRSCDVTPGGVILNGQPETGVLGVLVSLYAVNASTESLVLEPMLSYKDLPGTMPYHGAFAANTERPLIPRVDAIHAASGQIVDDLGGIEAPAGVSADFAFVVTPLPKIALCYLFYEADEDFPASATCLYSNNCNCHMPVDGLADVGEYTTKRILELV